VFGMFTIRYDSFTFIKTPQSVTFGTNEIKLNVEMKQNYLLLCLIILTTTVP